MGFQISIKDILSELGAEAGEPPARAEQAGEEKRLGMETSESLRAEIAKQEAHLASLKARLVVQEAKEEEAQRKTPRSPPRPLTSHEYERYGRQMIVPGFGLQAQLRLKQSRVLIVGAGGLGCPAGAYLAGAGVGTLGLADGDRVEASNLHRQIAHTTDRVGVPKVLSAIRYLQRLNPLVNYQQHDSLLSPSNAEAIVSQYDVVLDCTDNPATRYLVSDMCVLIGKPLVSASAFQTSGQLIVLNSPPGAGPCYRCVFPRPPPPETVVGCGEGGILGPVVGTMGLLQALEAIKLIARGGVPQARTKPKPETEHGLSSTKEEGTATVDGPRQQQQQHTMLLFSAMGDGGSPSFRSARMRGKRPDCFACSPEGGLTLQHLQQSMDYHQFCGVAEPVSLLPPEHRISAQDYHRVRTAQPDHILLDVREKEHFSLGSMPGAVNAPMSRFNRGQGIPDDVLSADARDTAPIYVVCRVGNDSQLVVQKLKDSGLDQGGKRFIGDIRGGLKAWKDAVDPTMPFI
ncbi:thiF family protein [Hirsutella rhossiliensis]|uniref:Adenylyltransferase and sulfurtransferase uba4 n=1 Tax=Hirsutella rhossiliensis TaxID=111463 RepID=A0A9P8MX46_9HYPO|nr:thiF family domain-containing protein [Hirsutella rhossiliensis]KAH0962799.1 thiF family domain-containing protein [Hirsutella rhossiliensis]